MDIMQQYNDTCAVKSQQIILNSFGIEIPESVLVQEATIKGYYHPGHGTNPENVGLLLEDHGVGTHTKLNATVYDLVAELSQGHKVIVGVDANELWRPSFFNDLFGEQANHALIVTGIDTSNPNDIRVILTDPGTGDVARSYPMEQFLDAWHDSSCRLIATDNPPLSCYDNGISNPEMINFDYSVGHIPYVGHVPFDYFVNNIVPEMDMFYNSQIINVSSQYDYDIMFDRMQNVYNSFDTAIETSLINNGCDVCDIDSMNTIFNNGYHFQYDSNTFELECIFDNDTFIEQDSDDMFNSLFFNKL